MATYNPPAFPRRPKESNILTETRYQLQLAYYRYEINTALYVMSPGEKLAYNLVVLSVLLVLAMSIYYYVPRTVQSSLQRLGLYILDSQRVKVSSMAVARAVPEAAASLADRGGPVLNMTDAAAFTP